MARKTVAELLVEAGIIPFGVEFKNPNFAKVAEAMGARGIRIKNPRTFEKVWLKLSRTRIAPLLAMQL
jgi:thiamine pyrophosphate-dependent acetolactate synthase large subunit-like protein